MTRHALCSTCKILAICAKPGGTVPNDSTKDCFFNNPQISNPRGAKTMASEQDAADFKLDSGEVKTAMKLRNAQSCATCGNARHNPGMGGPGDGFLECDANVLCRFKVERTQVCDHFNGSHGPKAMAR